MHKYTTTALVCTVLFLGAPTSWAAQKTLQAVRTETAPKIDGYIEEVWAQADSATCFIQQAPNEGEPATEKTVAYLLYDDQNIYVAFKCYDSQPEKLDRRAGRRDGQEGDMVLLLLDTFNDNITGYLFGVNSCNVQNDARVSLDGFSKDWSWDGVWFSVVRLTDFGYTVEMGIPFKNIRYKQDSSEWGIDFFRSISRKGENDWWSFQRSGVALEVSRAGRLVGIHPPKAEVSHLEVYPVGLVKYEKPSSSPEAGFDLAWHPTSSTNLMLTVKPDFAQVEADPYTVNLTKYPTYLSERRPFFIEGAEVFQTPMRLFYSRRIGKGGLPGGRKVPIITALKLTGRSGRFTLGAIGAMTRRTEYTGGVEPQSYYSVLRLKRQVFHNSELGLLYAGKNWEGGFNGTVGFDGDLRKEGFDLGFQLARSTRKNAEANYAGYLSLFWRAGDFAAVVDYKNIGENFDINGVGFEPKRGTESLNFTIGYISPKETEAFKWFCLTMGMMSYREYGQHSPGIGIGPKFQAGLKNNWQFSNTLLYKRWYEAGQWYNDIFTENKISTDPSKPLCGNLGFWYHSKRYNWRRRYLASMSALWGGLTWRPNPKLKLRLSTDATVEFKPDGSLEKISWILHPTVSWALTHNLYLRLWNEPNFDTDIHRSNILLSWNFLPKSWVYFALNNTWDNSEGNMRLKDRVIVLKVRYLFALL